MTWFKVDDGWARHPKVRKAGKDGRALWNAAGPECAAVNSDGHVPAHMVKDFAFFAEVNAKKATALLVASGLWHDEVTIHDCDHEDCANVADDLEPGSFFFHDWNDHQLTKLEAHDPVERMLEKRRKQLNRNLPLKQAVIRRDRGLCRYCAVRCDFGADHKSKKSGCIDHVDPMGTNAYDNLVVACRPCNGKKGHRTPEEAKMPLLPVPNALVLVAEEDPAGPGSDPAARLDDPAAGPDNQATDPDRVLDRAVGDPVHDPDQTQPHPAHARETGRVRIGSGSGPDNGPDRAGSKRAGSGRNGAGRSGSGRNGQAKGRAG